MSEFKECDWVEDDDYWQTNCGHTFQLNDGTPEQNGMKFCCYCGKPLVPPPAPRERPEHGTKEQK